jgi:hypothetical protein
MCPLPALLLLLACAPAKPEPTAPPPAAEPPPAEDPLAEIDAASAIPLHVEPLTGFDACHTVHDDHVIVMRGTVVGEGESKMFDGCEMNIVTPFEILVEEVVEGDLTAGQTIIVWEEGGKVELPDGRSFSAHSSRTCGRLRVEARTLKLCLYRAGPDFIPACCPGEG